MIRTVWLALICLITVAALALAKISAVPVATAEISEQSEAPKQTERKIATRAESLPIYVSPDEVKTDQPFGKSDKLKDLNLSPATTVTTLPIAIVPQKVQSKTAEEAPIKIISRHWRDPLAPKLMPKAIQSKRKL
jgi:hypothetical protein